MKPKFVIGDIVTIKGYGNTVYKIWSIMHERSFINGKNFEDFIYVCEDIEEGNSIEACWEDLTLVKASDIKQSKPELINDKTKSPPKKKNDSKVFKANDANTKLVPKNDEKEKLKVKIARQAIDDLLDEYIKSMSIYELFVLVGREDEGLEYKEHAEDIIGQLKRIKVQLD